MISINVRDPSGALLALSTQIEAGSHGPVSSSRCPRSSHPWWSVVKHGDYLGRGSPGLWMLREERLTWGASTCCGRGGIRLVAARGRSSCGGSFEPSEMAPHFQALRCCQCRAFQVQQVKKSKKWNCKLCGEKQSVLKVYGQGSGADCRHHVQKLNMLRGLTMEAATWPIEEPAYSSDDCQAQNFCVVGGQSQEANHWSVYLDQKPVEEPSDQEGDEVVYTDRQQFQADVKNACRSRSKRKRGSLIESVKLDPYGRWSGKESAGKKMKYVNSTLMKNANENPESGEATDILNLSKLDSNSAVHLGDKSKTDKAFRAKLTETSRWDKFLPSTEFFNCGTVNSGQQVWEQDSPSTPLPLAQLVLEDNRVLGDLASLVPSWDSWPSVSSSAGTEKVVTGLLTAGSEGLVKGAGVTVNPCESIDSKGVGNNACGAGKNGPIFLDRAVRSSCILKPGTLSSLLPPLTGGSPGTTLALTTKQPCSFMSLFQTDEDFDDL
ncbi:MRN complex-interacting protein [Narcine bancroftii]|uniref:MRN complex-interacting protein n=1 Tax=Narcine bancroftii TaxID=1343680 RepID=UPI003831D2C4